MRFLARSCYLLLVITLLLLFQNVFVAGDDSAGEEAATLPVNSAALEKLPESRFRGCKNLYSIPQIHSCIKDGDDKGLVLDLTSITTLLDGTEIDPAQIYGTSYIGPYPFEAIENRYTYKRYRRWDKISGGKGLINVGYLLTPAHNSEDWGGRGQVALRLDLFLEKPGKDRPLGLYDTFLRFNKVKQGFSKLPSITEGPFVNLVHSGNPSQILISLVTDREIKITVQLNTGKKFTDPKPVKDHEIPITGLEADTEYRYRLFIGEDRTKEYHFKTAPEKGKGGVIFAYIGDTREGVGGGERNFMGLNYAILERLLNIAYFKGAEFLAMGGDLVNGYTSVTEDFRTQLHAWKQAISGFRHERPVYPAIGNHEALLKSFRDESGKNIMLDRWPYETESAEAVFAAEFVNPRNAPAPSDPRRPTYSENVFSYQYGPVLMIAFNNNYWVSYDAENYGGCPEGYILPEQMKWIQNQLDKAEKDPTVKYVLLYAQEPVFPNGGHVKDAMWHDGDNNVRAYTWDAEKKKMIPEEKGIIEVRNEFALMISSYRKVAAVLGSDEHAYHKIAISRTIPVGVPEKDDKNKNGKLAEPGERISPLEEMKYTTWYLVCGGGGAPYYSEQNAPWNVFWKKKYPRIREHDVSHEDFYYYSSQSNFFLFEADSKKISLKVYNPYGEIIDRIDDMMEVKRKRF